MSQSMCHRISCAMSFSTLNFCQPEAVVLYTDRATLPLVTASLILGHILLTPAPLDLLPAACRVKRLRMHSTHTPLFTARCLGATISHVQVFPTHITYQQNFGRDITMASHMI